MKSRIRVITFIISAFAVMPLIGCGSANNVQTADVDALRGQLVEKEAQISTLKSSVETKSDSLRTVSSELSKKEMALNDALRAEASNAPAAVAPIGSELLPPKAKAGECFARAYVPPTYRTVVDTLLKTEASYRVEVIPAKYEWVEERVLVREEGKRFEVIPAQYKWVEETVQIREAHQEWKRGRGLVEKVNDATGEIMCLVDVPAQYRTVRKQVETRAASTKEVVIPAEYEMVKVRKMVTPPQEKRVNIAAEYQYVSRTVKTNDGRMEWRRVLCETNLTGDMNSKIQRALLDAGHHPGPIDGVIGPKTHTAIKSYQEANKLAAGGLTYETIAKLGINL